MLQPTRIGVVNPLTPKEMTARILDDWARQYMGHHSFAEFYVDRLLAGQLVHVRVHTINVYSGENENFRTFRDAIAAYPDSIIMTRLAAAVSYSLIDVPAEAVPRNTLPNSHQMAQAVDVLEDGDSFDLAVVDDNIKAHRAAPAKKRVRRPPRTPR